MDLSWSVNFYFQPSWEDEDGSSDDDNDDVSNRSELEKFEEKDEQDHQVGEENPGGESKSEKTSDLDWLKSKVTKTQVSYIKSSYLMES